MHKTGKNMVYPILTGIIILLMIILIIIHQRQPFASSIPEATPEEVLENAAKKHDGFSLMTVNTTISADVIQDGLKDMGELATEEYYFKEVVSYSSIKQFLPGTVTICYTDTRKATLMGTENVKMTISHQHHLRRGKMLFRQTIAQNIRLMTSCSVELASVNLVK
jgi:hypothetical protein